MNLIQRLDEYFIGTADEGTVSDRVYFYGLYVVTGLIAALTLANLN